MILSSLSCYLTVLLYTHYTTHFPFDDQCCGLNRDGQSDMAARQTPKKTAEKRSTLLFSIINEEQLGRLAPKPEQAHWDPLSVVTHPQTFYCVILNSLFRPQHGEIPLSEVAALQLSWKPRDASRPVGDSQCSGMHWTFCCFKVPYTIRLNLYCFIQNGGIRRKPRSLEGYLFTHMFSVHLKQLILWDHVKFNECSLRSWINNKWRRPAVALCIEKPFHSCAACSVQALTIYCHLVVKCAQVT